MKSQQVLDSTKKSMTETAKIELSNSKVAELLHGSSEIMKQAGYMFNPILAVCDGALCVLQLKLHTLCMR